MNNLTILLQAQPGGGITQMLFIAGIFAVFYFFFIRPQSKKANEQKKFMEEMGKGNRVVTSGGMIGKVSKIDDDSIVLEMDGGIKLRFLKSSISAEMSAALDQNKK